MLLTRPPFMARANSGLTFRPDANTALWLPGQDDAYSATIKDKSGNNNHGTITGATWTRLPSGLWCLSFDGTDDYVSLTSAPVDTTGDFSVECWTYKIDKAQDNDRILGFVPSANNGFQLTTDDASQKYCCTLTRGGADVFNSLYSAIVFDTWKHIAVTVSGTTGAFYLNGIEVAATAAGGAGHGETVGYTIGTRPDKIAASVFWRGYLALPRAYDGIGLSAATIAGHVNQERTLFGV